IQARGAIEVEWERRSKNLQIKRVVLGDFGRLSELLDKTSSSLQLDRARGRLAPYVQFPGVGDLLSAWAVRNAPRRLTLARVEDVHDACRLIESRMGHEDRPISLRRASAHVLGHSKRAEALVGVMDLALHGIDAEPQSADAVYDELGLMRYPQTMLVAGTVDLNLKSGPIHCPSPYGGVAPDSVVGCSGTVAYVLSVENLTVFHELALGHAGANAGLLLYTAGYPGRGFRAAYARLLECLPSEVPVYPWGASAEAGFLIAEALATTGDEADRELQLWLMGQFPTQDANLELSDRDVARIEYITQRRGWDGHFSVIQKCGKGIEQELQDLSLPAPKG